MELGLKSNRSLLKTDPAIKQNTKDSADSIIEAVCLRTPRVQGTWNRPNYLHFAGPSEHHVTYSYFLTILDMDILGVERFLMNSEYRKL